MKTKHFTLALLLAATSQAVKLKDIFDAYDQESAAEQAKKEDTIDPQALAAEIGGEQIAREVLLATGGLSDNTLLQVDEDIKVKDPSDKDSEQFKNYRVYENLMASEKERKNNQKIF